MGGYPYIDALMRQLAETGWIHHLGRHAVSCFLTRGDLWQSWTIGRDVFHKLLIDADGCLNNGNYNSNNDNSSNSNNNNNNNKTTTTTTKTNKQRQLASPGWRRAV